MLAHELTHIKRHDVAKKLLLTLVCILHWYNPAVWLLSARAARDIEEACDAETLHGRDAAYRAAYADALYTEYKNRRTDDTAALAALQTAFAGKTVRVLAPGASLATEAGRAAVAAAQADVTV